SVRRCHTKWKKTLTKYEKRSLCKFASIDPLPPAVAAVVSLFPLSFGCRSFFAEALSPEHLNRYSASVVHACLQHACPSKASSPSAESALSRGSSSCGGGNRCPEIRAIRSQPARARARDGRSLQSSLQRRI